MNRICFVVGDLSHQREDIHFSPLLTAQELANRGYSVSVLAACTPDIFQKWYQHYNKKSIRLISLNYQGPSISSLSTAVRSYHILHWMLENASEFDIVYFSLLKGLAYYTLLAKHQGWAFQHLEFCVDINSSTMWNKYIHKQWIDSIDDLADDFFEKESMRLADRVVFQDNDLFDWMQSQGWQLPKHIFNASSLFHNIEAKSSVAKISEGQPLVSICVTHFNRPHYLAQVLDSIRAQDYSNFEVVLVDDASTLPEAHTYLNHLTQEFKAKGWQIIRNKKNLFPGAARNLAARRSRGEYLLFMDDDNYAKPNQITTFTQVATQVGADILTCAMDVFEGQSAPLQNTKFIHRFLPMGAAAGLGLYLNMFGDMNALIKKKVYEALNGLTEDHGVGGEDWEFFSRAVLKGYHLETIPLALFWYRDTPSSVTKTTHLYENCLRGIRSYLDAVPSALGENLILAQAQQEKLSQLMREYNSLRKLLFRCWQLFSSRAWRVVCQPRKVIKKIAKKCWRS